MKIGIKNSLIYNLQNLKISTKGLFVKRIKYNKEFHKTLNLLEESQWFSEDQFRVTQNQKLKKLISYAYDNVPYYNELFKKHDILPSDITDLDDLKKIPILTKDILRNHPEKFVSKSVNKNFLISGWTTGTTGTPLNAYRSRSSVIFENATLWRQKRWAGVDISSPKVAIWGTIWDKVIVPNDNQNPPFWRMNFPENQLLLSYYHISDKTLPIFLEKLNQFKPEYIEGFPSIILTIARYLKKHKLTLPIKAVFTSSEPLYDTHREDIEESFETKIYDHYGQAERVSIATECPEHNGLHINPEYGILELLNNNNDVKPGESGEIISTGLNNYVMPLIRYKTGDMASISKKQCKCGRNMPLLHSVEGRKTDRIITPQGKIIPGGGIMGAFHGISNIQETQVIQEDLNHVTIKIVKENIANNIDTAQLNKNLEKCLGSDINFKFDNVPTLFSADQIKKRWVISKVKID